MRSATTTPAPPATQPTPERAAHLGPSVDSELTWLLHRAAQRLRAATDEQAQQHGIQLRDHIVLSALHKSPNLTQAELGKALGLDKTTLTSQLDRLERMGLVVRQTDPADRRARIPAITEAGEGVRAEVAAASAAVEEAAVRAFSQEQVVTFRQMLVEIIGESQDRGSCL